MRPLFETAGQPFVFLLMVYAGAGSGLLMDLSSLVRRRKGGWLQGLTDSMILCLLGASAALILIQTRQESLHYYGILGMLLGWLVYDLGIRTLIRSIASSLKKTHSGRK